MYIPIRKKPAQASNELSISNRVVITSFPGHQPPELKGRGTLLLVTTASNLLLQSKRRKSPKGELRFRSSASAEPAMLQNLLQAAENFSLCSTYTQVAVQSNVASATILFILFSQGYGKIRDNKTSTCRHACRLLKNTQNILFFILQKNPFSFALQGLFFTWAGNAV